MIPAIKKVWLYTFCLFLLTLGCISVNSSNREDTPNSQTSAPRGIPISNGDRTKELFERLKIEPLFSRLLLTNTTYNLIKTYPKNKNFGDSGRLYRH